MQDLCRYALRILVAFLIPCIFYIVPKVTGSNNDFQAVGFALFSLMMLGLTYLNNLYDVDNIAAELSIASMEEAFIVLDGHNLFKGSNKVAEKLFPDLKNAVLDSDVLAGMEGISYRLQELQLEEGDRLYLYTDGVTEATDSDNNLYGEDRLLHLMAEKHALDAESILTAVKEDIDLFVQEAEQFDDISMVTVDYGKKG